MPNLFPTTTTDNEEQTTENENNEIIFGRSWKFDFEKGDFVTSPNGKIIEVTEEEAWLEWCKKALATERYHHLVYSRNHGQEFDNLIAKDLTREANESEIKRITTECLMVDPRTAGVDQFHFEWNRDQVFFSCIVTNVRGESGDVTGQVKIK